EFEIEIGEFEQDLRDYEEREWKKLQDKAIQRRRQQSKFLEVVNDFSIVLTQARNERVYRQQRQWPEVAPAMVCGVDLLAADLDQALAAGARAALSTRLDLMNARAQLVDCWRQICVLANSLMGFFNIRYQMDTFTPPFQATPFAFGDSRTTHRMVMNIQPPLVRVVEKSNYRAVLIAYQRQRRQLMAAEDDIVRQARSEIRQLRFLAENFKIQTKSVELQYNQVENAAEVFFSPPTVAGAGGVGNAAANAAALTNQLLGAQNGLLSSQNLLFTTWINYLV